MKRINAKDLETTNPPQLQFQKVDVSNEIEYVYLMNSTFMSKGIGTNNSFMRLYMKSTVLLYLE